MDKIILESAQHCVNDGACFKCYVEGGYYSCVAMFANAIVEHHERYGWHDLRKNPDDLPTDYTCSFECVELWFDGDKTVSIGTASYISECAFGKSLNEDYDVIAWREIDLEQFESEGMDE